MPTKFMKFSFDQQVLQHLENTIEQGKPIGYTVDFGFNYYRGTPISAVERFEVWMDGERVPDNDVLIEVNGKFLRVHELPLAHTEYWGVRTPLKIHVFGPPLTPGAHDVDIICEARVVYMEFAPGAFGKLDASARKTMTVEE